MTTMDNSQGTAESSALDTNQAAAAFAELLGPKEPTEAQDPPEAQQAEPEAEVETEVQAETQEDDPVVTVKIDGQEVEVKLSELKNGYQKDKVSTERFMQAAEIRRAAEAERQQANQERQQLAVALQQADAVLRSKLSEFQNVNWDELSKADPAKWVELKNLYDQRHSEFQQNNTRLQQLAQIQQAEAQKAQADHIAKQQEELLAKLPDWKDETKAKAEKTAIREYLKDQGFDEQSINNVSDAKAVLMARKAMLYDQMVAKAAAATKKVATLPTKVERPGVTNTEGLDRRGAAFQKLSKSGRVEDAASVFASFL